MKLRKKRKEPGMGEHRRSQLLARNCRSPNWVDKENRTGKLVNKRNIA